MTHADKAHVVVARRKTGGRHHLVGESALHRQHGVFPMLVDHRDTARRSLRQKRHHLRAIRRVRDHEDLFGRLEIDDHVVDHAAIGVADQGVLSLTRADLAKVRRQAPVDEVSSSRPSHRRFAKMTDVENADRVTDRRVLGQHPGAGVLHWHRPSAEGCKPCAGYDMPFVQRRRQ